MPEYGTIEDLKRLMQELDLNRTQVGELVGRHRNSVSRWLNEEWPVPKFVIEVLEREKENRNLKGKIERVMKGVSDE